MFWVIISITYTSNITIVVTRFELSTDMEWKLLFLKNERIICDNESVYQKLKGTIRKSETTARTVPKRFMLLKVVTQKKSNERRNLSSFTAVSITNSITEFKYCSEEGKTFPSYFRRYTDLYKKELFILYIRVWSLFYNTFTKDYYYYWLLVLDIYVCLFVWVLWHINLCWLFNAKSIFIQINSFISNNSV